MEKNELINENQKNFEKNLTDKIDFQNQLNSLKLDLKKIAEQLEEKKVSSEKSENINQIKKQLDWLVANLELEDKNFLAKNIEFGEYKNWLLNLQLEVLSKLRNEQFIKSDKNLSENIQNSIETFASVIAKNNKQKIISETKKNIPEIINFYWPLGWVVKKIAQKADLI